MFNHQGKADPDHRDCLAQIGEWQGRAIAAEAALKVAQEGMEGFDLLMQQRASLVSITREGRYIRFMFMRNNRPTVIKVMGTWDDDVEGWKRELFGNSQTA
jgi:hypothetical protein